MQYLEVRPIEAHPVDNTIPVATQFRNSIQHAILPNNRAAVIRLKALGEREIVQKHRWLLWWNPEGTGLACPVPYQPQHYHKGIKPLRGCEPGLKPPH